MIRGIASRKYLTDDQLARLISAAGTRRHRNALRDQVLLALIGVAGLTPAEVLRVRRRDILVGPRVFVTAGRRPRPVRLPAPLARLVVRLVRRLTPAARLFPITGRQARRLFCLYARRAGLPEARLYSLRHTAAVRLWRQVGDVDHLQAILGHVSKQSTQLYAHFELELELEALAHHTGGTG